jgi:hypothetical protein
MRRRRVTVLRDYGQEPDYPFAGKAVHIGAMALDASPRGPADAQGDAGSGATRQRRNVVRGGDPEGVKAAKLEPVGSAQETEVVASGPRASEPGRSDRVTPRKHHDLRR